MEAKSFAGKSWLVHCITVCISEMCNCGDGKKYFMDKVLFIYYYNTLQTPLIICNSTIATMLQTIVA